MPGPQSTALPPLPVTPVLPALPAYPYPGPLFTRPEVPGAGPGQAPGIPQMTGVTPPAGQPAPGAASRPMALKAPPGAVAPVMPWAGPGPEAPDLPLALAPLLSSILAAVEAALPGYELRQIQVGQVLRLQSLPRPLAQAVLPFTAASLWELHTALALAGTVRAILCGWGGIQTLLAVWDALVQFLGAHQHALDAQQQFQAAVQATAVPGGRLAIGGAGQQPWLPTLTGLAQRLASLAVPLASTIQGLARAGVLQQPLVPTGVLQPGVVPADPRPGATW